MYSTLELTGVTVASGQEKCGVVAEWLRGATDPATKEREIFGTDVTVCMSPVQGLFRRLCQLSERRV